MRRDDLRDIIRRAPIRAASDRLLYQRLCVEIHTTAEVTIPTRRLCAFLKIQKRSLSRVFRRLEAAGLVASSRAGAGRAWRRRVLGLRGWTDEHGPRWAFDPAANDFRAAPRAPSPSPSPAPSAVLAHPSKGAGDRRLRDRHLDHVGPIAANFGAARTLPADFEPSPETWDEVNGFRLAEETVRREALKFRDYYARGGKGARETSSNWDWKFIDWIKRAAVMIGRDKTALAAVSAATPAAAAPSADQAEIDRARAAMTARFKPRGVDDVFITFTATGRGLKAEGYRRGRSIGAAYGATLAEVESRLAAKVEARAGPS